MLAVVAALTGGAGALALVSLSGGLTTTALLSGSVDDDDE